MNKYMNIIKFKMVADESEGQRHGECDAFEALLAASSVGSPEARARQALTPPDVLRRFADDLDRHHSGGSSVEDVDDLVLKLVELLGGQADDVPCGPEAPRVTEVFDDPMVMVITGPPGAGKSSLISHLTKILDITVEAKVAWWSHSQPDIAFRCAGLLQDLIDFDAMSGIRPQVVDGILRTAFAMEDAPWVVRSVCLSILDSESVAEQLYLNTLLLLDRLPAPPHREPAQPAQLMPLPAPLMLAARVDSSRLSQAVTARPSACIAPTSPLARPAIPKDVRHPPPLIERRAGQKTVHLSVIPTLRCFMWSTVTTIVTGALGLAAVILCHR